MNHISIVVDGAPLDYKNLKKMLDSFYCICSVAIKGFVTQTTARKIISCLPMSPSSAKLKLYCEPGAESLFKDAVQQNSKRPTAVKINELQR